MTKLFQSTKKEIVEQRYADAEVKDKKGRAVGFDIRIYREWFKASVGSGYSLSRLISGDEGKVFFVRVQQVRDGEWFGSSTSGKFFLTIDEVEKYVAKTVKSRIARAKKSFGK